MTYIYFNATLLFEHHINYFCSCIGVKIRQYWSEAEAPGESGWYDAVILNKKPGHGQLCAVKYSNAQEMWIMKKEEQTFRAQVVAHELSAWTEAIAKIAPAFEYIEQRLTNDCDAPYHMKAQHEQFKCLEVFANL